MSREALARVVEKESRSGKTVLVIGGNGGMSDRYRDVAEQHGLSLRHYETRVPRGVRRDVGKVALVIIMVTMVSHSLREQAQNLGIDDAPVVYLRSPSVSALRGALAEWAA